MEMPQLTLARRAEFQRFVRHGEICYSLDLRRCLWMKQGRTSNEGITEQRRELAR